MKRTHLILLIFLCFTLAGCMFRGKPRVEQLNEETSSEKEIADNMMENITEALDNGDAEALKELYAKPAIEATPDLDEQIEALIDYYQGRTDSYNGTIHSSTSYKSGKSILEINGMYQLVTTEETYQIDFYHKPVDDINEDEIGLYKMEIVTQENYDKEVDIDGYYHWKYNDEETGAYYSFSDME